MSLFYLFPAGHASPNQILLGGVKVFPTKAEISFTVTSVAYTPETYAVTYGTSREQLNRPRGNLISTNITDLTFLTDTNLNYTIVLENLRSTQMYYYYVVAKNTLGTTKSDLSAFTTLEPCKINTCASWTNRATNTCPYFNNVC